MKNDDVIENEVVSVTVQENNTKLISKGLKLAKKKIVEDDKSY